MSVFFAENQVEAHSGTFSWKGRIFFMTVRLAPTIMTKKKHSFASGTMKPTHGCSLLYAKESVKMKAPYGPMGCVLKHRSWVTVSHIICSSMATLLLKLLSCDQREGRTRLSYLFFRRWFWKEKKKAFFSPGWEETWYYFLRHEKVLRNKTNVEVSAGHIFHIFSVRLRGNTYISGVCDV